MGDCNETLRELQIYLDGELAGGARYVIDEHLQQCDDCLQAFDFHAELRVVIATKCKTEAMPPELLRKIEACFGVEADNFSQDAVEAP